MNARAPLGLIFASALMLGLHAGGAEAFVGAPIPIDAASLVAATPVAMCGNSCRNGGRYIPGPPSVCEDHDLNYCGPSRRGPEPGAGVYVPGTGIGIGVGPGGPGVAKANPPPPPLPQLSINDAATAATAGTSTAPRINHFRPGLI